VPNARRNVEAARLIAARVVSVFLSSSNVARNGETVLSLAVWQTVYIATLLSLVVGVALLLTRGRVVGVAPPMMDGSPQGRQLTRIR
jgi:hypothetical protein